MDFRSTRQDLVLLLLRLAAGGAMVAGHGLRKLSRLLEGDKIHFSDPIGLGPELSFYLVVFAEAFCAVLICVGLFTRLATIPLVFMLLVIIFVVHAGDPFSKIELPLLYLAGFLVLLVFGPGRFSLDAWKKSRW